MVNNTCIFNGKNRYQSSGGQFMSLDAGNAIILSKKEELSGRFNVYRMGSEQVTIQAMNGLYLSVQLDNTLSADKKRGEGTVFTLHKNEAGKVLLSCGPESKNKYYICESGNKVVMCEVKEGITPPPGTGFKQVEIAPGLAEIEQKGAENKDLDWADLRGSGGLSGVNFEGCSACHADLSGTMFNKANFNKAKLEQANLKNAMFQSTSFVKSTLTGANLSMANGKGADFSGADLSKCNMKWMIGDNCSFSKANMVQSDCFQAYFERADFKEAAMRNCNLSNVIWADCQILGADLSGAILTETNFRSVKMDGSTVFSGATLNNCNFREMDLKGIHLSHCDLQGAYFDGADLTGSDLSYSNLRGAHFTKHAILIGATLVNSYLQDADFTDAQLGYAVNAEYAEGEPGQEGRLSAADLTGAFMPNAVFNGANMNGINMSGVNWYGSEAKALRAYMHQINFSNANLGSMKFDQADLRGSTFDYANLIGCSFKKAVLRAGDNSRRVSFSFANIQGTDFFESEIEDAVFSNAGVALPVEWNFTVTGENVSRYREELNRDGMPVSAELRSEFTRRGFPLPDDAVVRVWATGYKWDVISDVDPNITAYELTLESGRLEIRSGPDGVPLFRLSDKAGVIQKGLDGGLIIQELKELMKEAGYPLKVIASVSDITTGRKWGIDNDFNDGHTLQRGYLEFYITRDPDGMLTVYGTILGTVRVGDDDIWEQVRHVMASTRWVPDLLRGDSICPSGHKIQIVNNPRPEISMTWKEAVMAKTLPQEPECIPSPYTWCSPERGCSIKWIK